MPTLDVSEILDDPEFADTATVYRNAVAVDPVTGRTTVTTTSTAILCVVTSDKGRNLQRNPQAALSEGSIIVHSTFTFTEGGNGVDADELDWNGRKWTVVVVDDYSRYGAGFTCAMCRLLDLR